MKKNDNIEIGKRLSEEIERMFGSQKEAAQAIGAATGSYFRPYLEGKSRPGMTFRKRLGEAGFDVDYIMTGQKNKTLNKEEVKQSFEKLQSKLENLSNDLKELKNSITTT